MKYKRSSFSAVICKVPKSVDLVIWCVVGRLRQENRVESSKVPRFEVGVEEWQECAEVLALVVLW